MLHPGVGSISGDASFKRPPPKLKRLKRYPQFYLPAISLACKNTVPYHEETAPAGDRTGSDSPRCPILMIMDQFPNALYRGRLSRNAAVRSGLNTGGNS